MAICLLLLAVKIIEFMPQDTLSLLMALEFEWGSFQMFPGLTGVVEFLNMFAKMSASPTRVGRHAN